MECILESDEEEVDKFEINPLVTHPMPKLTTQRSYGNMNHPSVRTIGMPRAKTCDKPLEDFEKNSSFNNLGLNSSASVAAMQRVTSSASMSEAARRRKVSVISNISNMDFTGSYLQLYLDVGDDALQDFYWSNL